MPFVQTLGVDIGYKVWSSLASLAPVVPVYLFTRRLGALPTLFAAGFLLLDLNHAEMVVTGALPLIAFGLLGTAWWAMCSLVERWSWRCAAVLTSCVGLIPWVNQTTAGLAVVTIPVFAAALLWYNRGLVAPQENRPSLERTSLAGTGLGGATSIAVARRLIFPLALGAMIALGALPWYVQVLPGSKILHFPGPWIYPSAWSDLIWLMSLMAITLGIYVAHKASEPTLRAVGAMLVFLGLLAPWLSYDETIINVPYRARYLMAVPFFIAISWVTWTKWIPAIRKQVPDHPWAFWVPIVGIALALAIMGFGYASQFQRQSGYSDMATVPTAEALAFLRRTDPDKAIVSNSFTLSLWIAGLNKVKSPFAFTAPPPRAYIEDDEDIRCLLNWVPECDPTQAKDRLAVGYILVDYRFPNLNLRSPGNYKAPPNQWGLTEAAPWLVLVYAKDTTRLWRITSGVMIQ